MMMRTLAVIVAGGWLVAASAQSPPISSLRSTFAAVIVKDLDIAIEWYERVLGFAVVNKIDLPERGVFIAILSRDGADLELLALANALDPQSLASEAGEAARFFGFFKVGFEVADFSEWLIWFEAQKVDFHGNVVRDPQDGKEMVILKDPNGNYIQIFEE